MLQEEELSVAAKPDAKTILVVEDDEDTRLLFTEAFSMLTPYEVQVARNSTEALHFVKHRKPDLFILDYRLPQTNGIELYDQLHAIPGLENIPAIIISGIASDQVTRDIDSRKLLRIDKPFDLDEFLDVIKQALGQTSTKKIESELEDTIDVLTEVIHTGYNIHEERIKRLEDQAEQPHKN